MPTRDLQRFDYRHNPSLAFDASLPEIIEDAIAVGWLSCFAPQVGELDGLQRQAIEFAHREQSTKQDRAPRRDLKTRAI